jgi:two-component system sensor histidine kinase and response regulator WspE
MRAAHSIKGAARVINLDPIVRLAHAMEDCFVAGQQDPARLTPEKIDQLLRSVDFLSHLSKLTLKEVRSWLSEQMPLIDSLIEEFNSSNQMVSIPKKELPKTVDLKGEAKESPSSQQDRALRITAENLNRLMGLAGESLVESRWLHPFVENLQEFKHQLANIEDLLNLLQDHLPPESFNEIVQHCLTQLHDQIRHFHSRLNERFIDFDYFIRRHAHLSDRLYQEVINSRMRPFADGVQGFPRMVRDLAHQLGKQVRLEIEGKSTLVDREILEKLESPLSHLLRNAVDHGIESPEERLAAGKPIEGVIKLKAHHRAGMLAITVADDGRGIDVEQLRHKIVKMNLTNVEMAQRLTDAEVIDFLFLPGFSTSRSLTEISGRGVGLNIVQKMAQEVGGVVQTHSILGQGTSFNLQLPLTLSVIRALLVEISGEIYAFPLAKIDQAFFASHEEIKMIENRPFFHHQGQNIGLVPAWEVLGLNEFHLAPERLPIIIVSEQGNRYGLVVERFIEEKELVIQELDPWLGKIPTISAGALLEDGSPVLMIDVEDIVRSIDYLLSGGRLAQIVYSPKKIPSSRKRILVVDDSITVREIESRLLMNQGYEVETAINGVDGWNAIHMGHYDLVLTDLDMPRMNGIELLRAMRNDAQLQHLPVIIVSYKEGEEDRIKGLEAGANDYLMKSSFQATTLIEKVKKLIGDP